MRLCARVALPAEPAVGSPADHGYTYGWHLDHEGAPTQDPIYVGDDGQPIYYARPKVCAYWDPSFYDALANYAAFLFGGGLAAAVGIMSAATAVADPVTVQVFKDSVGDNSAADVGMSLVNMLQANLQPDLWDLNPIHQAIHYHQGGVFFVFQLLIQLIRMGVGMGNMMESLVDSLPDGLKYTIMVISSLYWIIRAFTIIGPEVMIPVLEYLGQFNNVVAQALGCTLISLGPYPPPYCQDIILPPPRPSLTSICRTTNAGIESSNGINRCVNSNLVNNAIRNSVRVGFRDLRMVCPQGVEPNDSCVRIYPFNAAAVYNASVAAGKPGIVNVCNGANSNLPCVESPTLLERCGADPAWCNKGIRLIFGARAGSNDPIALRDNYDSTLPACPSANGPCQLAWGVNIGNWEDYSLVFPSMENGHNTAPLSSDVYSMIDPNGVDFSFKLMIPRTNTTIDNVEVDSSSIYLVNDTATQVYESVTRAAVPKPTVYDCNSQGVNCVSDHLRPGIVAKIEVGADSTKGALSTDTHLSPRPVGTLANHRLNLAGTDFTTFVTDSNYRQSPFDDANSPYPSTRLGDYTGYVGALEYYENGVLTPANAIYAGGLEYYQNKYVMGGEQICLTGFPFPDCLTSQTRENCVLVNLQNDDQVRCTDFVNLVFARYNGIGICTAAQGSQYNTIETVQVPKPISGNLAVTVKGASANGPYCYDWNGRVNLGTLCNITQIPAERVTPGPVFGAVLPSSEFYNYNPQSPPNSNSLGVRNKNAVEQGMCVDVPEMTCASTSGNNANWTITDLGDRATGTCGVGYVPKGPNALLRYCTLDRSTNSAIWETLTASMGCQQGCSVSTNFPNRTFHAANKYISLGSGNKGTGIYVYTLTLNVDDPSQFTNLKIIVAGADDSFKIEVNGVQVMGEPGSYNPGHEYSHYYGYAPNLDIKPYLSPGVNNIVFTLSVVGGGMGHLGILYDHPNCPSVTIDPI